MSDIRLVALRYPNRRMAERISQLWDEGLAVLPIDPAAPDPMVGGMLDRLRPHLLEEETGVTRLRGGIPVDEDVACVVATSGSSGEPKGVELSWSALGSSAAAYTRRLGTGSGNRWLCCLPLSHIGGLGILARSRLAGTPPVVHDRFDVEAIAGETRTTLISLVPTTLLRLMEAGVDLSSYAAVLVGGAGLPAAAAERARQSEVRLVRTYGMTETCGGCNFDGAPLDGVQMRIQQGQILIRGPMLMNGYRLDPALTAEVIRDGWLHTADRGRMRPDGTLEVLGRLDDVIVSGGQKVSPVEVEEVLATHPAVADAAVAGLPDPVWGQAVAALVVTAGEGAPEIADLKSLVSRRIGAFKAPKRVVVVDRIPRTATGKIRRDQVRQLLERSPAAGPRDAP